MCRGLPELWGMNGGEDIAWCLRGHLVHRKRPLVMGIINITPDSFYRESRHGSVSDALRTADRMLEAGASILDVGGASSRPGSTELPEAEERERVLPIVVALAERFPGTLISIDTWQAHIAADAVAVGASMVNDISAGLMDPKMLGTVAGLRVPYVLMHMQGTPRTMQRAPHYTDVLSEVVKFLSERVLAARQAGIADVIVDPGFGFGKDRGHNFALLKGLRGIKALGVPVLVGLSRKRMINEVLGTVPETALNGTTVLNTIALQHGADILRVHDVQEAVEAVKLLDAFAA